MKDQNTCDYEWVLSDWTLQNRTWAQDGYFYINISFWTLQEHYQLNLVIGSADLENFLSETCLCVCMWFYS